MERPLTIVEATNRLGIGGVESHVMRLAEGLVGRGHRVILMIQNQGDQEEQAREIGAELFIVPFSRKGCETAQEMLLDEDVDIIHAHNYRAARFAAPVAKLLEVAYLMTVHGPRPWYQRALFREWSDPVVTVSEADRDNITGLFGVDEDRVVVSFLGVDTGRFRPGVEAQTLRAEWNVPADRPLIVNVSRFSHRKARPALALIDALPLVRERVPGTSLVLVGDGPELERIRAEAERLDAPGSAPIAQTVGPRSDIPRVLDTADVAVAAATTALEALASATPTIAYGRTGYFGPVTPTNFEEARALCFADHGRKLPARIDRQRLADDLVSLLTDPRAARRQAAEVRAIIESRYIVERMVDHLEGLYHRVVVERSPGRGT